MFQTRKNIQLSSQRIASQCSESCHDSCVCSVCVMAQSQGRRASSRKLTCQTAIWNSGAAGAGTVQAMCCTGISSKWAINAESQEARAKNKKCELGSQFRTDGKFNKELNCFVLYLVCFQICEILYCMSYYFSQKVNNLKIRFGIWKNCMCISKSCFVSSVYPHVWLAVISFGGGFFVF